MNDPDMETKPNLSTEHQKPGDAKKPGEQLDKDRVPADDGGRKSKLLP